MAAQLVSLLLQSPKGLIAITTVIGSISALIYLYLLNSSSGKPRSSSKRSSPGSAKKTPAKKASKAASPVPEKITPSKHNKQQAKETKLAKATSEKKSTATSNSSAKKTPSKITATSGASPKKNSEKPANTTKKVSSNSAQTKEEGEWITVNKKKARATSTGKKPVEEIPASKQTRGNSRSGPPRASKSRV